MLKRYSIGGMLLTLKFPFNNGKSLSLFLIDIYYKSIEEQFYVVIVEFVIDVNSISSVDLVYHIFMRNKVW